MKTPAKFPHIAHLLKSSRARTSMSQEELSRVLGYRNGQFISNVERGLCSVPYKIIHPLSALLGISVEDIKAAILKDVGEEIDRKLGRLTPPAVPEFLKEAQ